MSKISSILLNNKKELESFQKVSFFLWFQDPQFPTFQSRDFKIGKFVQSQGFRVRNYQAIQRTRNHPIRSSEGWDLSEDTKSRFNQTELRNLGQWIDIIITKWNRILNIQKQTLGRLKSDFRKFNAHIRFQTLKCHVFHTFFETFQNARLAKP